MKEKFEVIGVYQNVHTAYIHRDRLIAEGINAWVTDENTVMRNPFYSDELGSAKLQVPEKEVDKARNILETIEKTAMN